MKKSVPLSTDPLKSAEYKTELRELTEIRIDHSLPLKHRMQRFIADVRDPYNFTVNGTVVRICFTGKNSISDRLVCALNVMAEMRDDHSGNIIDLTSAAGNTVA